MYMIIWFAIKSTRPDLVWRRPEPSASLASLAMFLTVAFHNFNLRNFNLRVSDPSKLIVDVFFDTMSDFNVPGSRPNKNTMKFRKPTVRAWEWEGFMIARATSREPSASLAAAAPRRRA